MGSKNSSKTQHMIRPVTQLLLHPAGPQLCVAQLHVPEEVSPAPNPNGPLRNEDIFVLIVDHSYSMDTYSTKLVQEVFPLLLAKLDVSSEEEVLLVIFSDSADGYWVKAGELVNFRLPYQGYTYMSPVWSVLERMLLGDGLDSQGMRVGSGVGIVGICVIFRRFRLFSSSCSRCIIGYRVEAGNPDSRRVHELFSIHHYTSGQPQNPSIRATHPGHLRRRGPRSGTHHGGSARPRSQTTTAF